MKETFGCHCRKELRFFPMPFSDPFSPGCYFRREVCGETRVFYLNGLDYSRNKEAKVVPFVKRLDVVEGRKDSARAWRVWKIENTIIGDSYRKWVVF
jgi:hypothetical protein